MENIYNTYHKKDCTHAGISHVPYFTAIMYGNEGMGRWHSARFDKITKKPRDYIPKNIDFCLECVDSGIPDSSSLMEETLLDR